MEPMTMMALGNIGLNAFNAFRKGKEPDKFSYPGMGGDLKLAGQARGKIGEWIPQLDPKGMDSSYIAKVRSMLDRGTTETYDRRIGEHNDRMARSGRGRSKMDAGTQAMMNRGEASEMGNNDVNATERGMNLSAMEQQKILAAIQTMMGVKAPGMQIGQINAQNQRDADATNAGRWGGLGNAFGQAGTAMMWKKLLAGQGGELPYTAENGYQGPWLDPNG